MKQTLLVITTAMALIAMLPKLADAQRGAGSGGGGGGAGGAAPGGGGGAAAGGGGAASGGGGGGLAVAGRGGSGTSTMGAPPARGMSAPTSGAMSAPSARGGGIGMSGGSPRGAWTGRNVAGPSGGNWQGGPHWQGQHFAQRHHRTPFVTSGFAAPYFYDDSWPYDSYYGDNGCWAIRYIRGAYRRVWVCY